METQMRRLLCLTALIVLTATGGRAQDKPAPAAPPTAPAAAPDADKAAAEARKKTLTNVESLNEKAPDVFQTKFETTRGDFVVEVTRAWSPNGADRFYNLAKNGFFDGIKFFRVVPNFVVQFGIHGDPEIAGKWDKASIPDDKVVSSNKRGYLTYAMSSQPNSRTTQLFINLKDNTRLDEMGFAPFGRVIKGMDVVDKLYSGYGEQITELQDTITAQGNAYLDKEWPKLDAIKRATIVKPDKPADVK
jgi:peptidyl-prolyl cis-trans isomerase A (cyclophilin A)